MTEFFLTLSKLSVFAVIAGLALFGATVVVFFAVAYFLPKKG